MSNTPAPPSREWVETLREYDEAVMSQEGPKSVAVIHRHDLLEYLEAQDREIEELKQRHKRYYDNIGTAIGKRELRSTGEPAKSDAAEIWRMRNQLAGRDRRIEDLNNMVALADGRIMRQNGCIAEMKSQVCDRRWVCREYQPYVMFEDDDTNELAERDRRIEELELDGQMADTELEIRNNAIAALVAENEKLMRLFLAANKEKRFYKNNAECADNDLDNCEESEKSLQAENTRLRATLTEVNRIVEGPFDVPDEAALAFTIREAIKEAGA